MKKLFLAFLSLQLTVSAMACSCAGLDLQTPWYRRCSFKLIEAIRALGANNDYSEQEENKLKESHSLLPAWGQSAIGI